MQADGDLRERLLFIFRGIADSKDTIINQKYFILINFRWLHVKLVSSLFLVSLKLY